MTIRNLSSHIWRITIPIVNVRRSLISKKGFHFYLSHLLQLRSLSSLHVGRSIKIHDKDGLADKVKPDLSCGSCLHPPLGLKIHRGAAQKRSENVRGLPLSETGVDSVERAGLCEYATAFSVLTTVDGYMGCGTCAPAPASSNGSV